MTGASLPLLCTLVGILSQALSAQAVPQAAERSLEKCSIAGQVVRAGTGEPLKKARVVVRKADGYELPQTVITDASGSFELRGIEPGRYRLWVVRKGYVRQEYGQTPGKRSGSALTLSAGERLRDVLFQLIPAGVITGRIYDEDGEATSVVLVQAEQYGSSRGRRSLYTSGQAVTDDRGDFRIHGLEPGDYYVSATYNPTLDHMIVGRSFASSSRTDGSTPEEGYMPTYYPGATDPSRATPVQVHAGEEVGGIDLTLQRTRTVRVRGRIVNAITGRPGHGVSVMLNPREQSGHRLFVHNQDSVVDLQGNFEIRGVTPGSYALLAQWFDQESNKQYTAHRPLEVGISDIDGIELVIERGVDVSGTLRIEGAANASLEEQRQADALGRNQRGKLQDAELHVVLIPSDELAHLGSYSAQVKDDRTFVVENVSTGEYRVTAGGRERDYYLKAARLGGVDVLEEGLHLTGPPENPLELVLSAATGQVQGVVLDEERKPVTGTRVVLVPEPRRRKRTELFKETLTDQYGRFTLRGAPPGEYKLFAWEELDFGGYQDPEFLKPYEEQGETVRIDEGSQLSVELKVIRAE